MNIRIYKPSSHLNTQLLCFCVFLMFLTFSSCGVAKPVESISVLSVKFGSSGGFTGERIEFELRQNGELLKNNVQIKKIDQTSTNLQLIEVQNLLQLNIDDKGNLSKFMTITTRTETKEFIWHVASKNLDERIPKTYQSLLNLTR